jgi:hypothetical protein
MASWPIPPAPQTPKNRFGVVFKQNIVQSVPAETPEGEVARIRDGTNAMSARQLVMALGRCSLGFFRTANGDIHIRRDTASGIALLSLPVQSPNTASKHQWYP